jgi:hypothetical protein
MKWFAAASCAVFLLIVGVVYVTNSRRPLSEESRLSVNSYFAEEIQKKAFAFEAAHPKEDVAGFTGGVSGFLLLKAFPGFVPADFDGIQARSMSGESGGEYSEKDGRLSFFGHAASDSANIPSSEMEKLLANVSHRLSLPTRTTADIDALIAKISK